MISGGSIQVRLRPVLDLTNDELFELCALNPELRIERTAEGDMVIMMPTGGETGSRNADIVSQLAAWARADGSGVAFDSSTGFTLPNGAMRSPDASWVRRSRLALLNPSEKKKFLPLCPDFALELRSPTDDLDALKGKLEEYLDNGAELALLIDPIERQVHRYLRGEPPEILDAPSEVSGEPLLPGFRLRLQEIWEPNW